MKVRSIIAIGSWLCMLAVVLGAMGAHALENLFDAHQMSTFETAVRYHFLHALGLLILPLLPINPSYLKWIAYMFMAGIVLFSGSLYLWCFLDSMDHSLAKTIGMVAPVGGFTLIAAWAYTGYSALKS